MGDSEKTPLLNSSSNNSTAYNEAVTEEVPVDTNHSFQSPIYGSNHGQTVVDVRRTNSLVDTPLPTTISWSNVDVSVVIPGKRRGCCGGEAVPAVEKKILKGVNGLAKPGSLLAIMGASGAGKSTLLNVLTQRNIRSYKISGEIRLNGWQIGDKIKNVSAYVQQDDLFIGTLTVREQLQFRALLRMDKRLNREARLARVEDVINEIGLSDIANSRIGTAGGSSKGISGGERKRLSFASEALTNPPLFFCDEPTSGLDTFMAQNIISTLQRMASKGRAILCTIHQPSSELFAMFNQILLLAEGRTAFMGSREETMTFFQSMNFPCPQNFNPADHYILTLAIVPGKEEECRKRTNAICDAYAQSPMAENIIEENKQLVEQSRQSRGDSLLEEATKGDTRYQASWLTQFRYLFWRAWISQFRDVILFRVRVMQTVVAALVIGLVFLRLTLDQKGIQDINGGIFIIITNISFSNMFAVVNSFPIEMAIFLREYGTRLYQTDVYYLTKTLCEFPVFLVIGTLFVAVVYWMMGLYESADAFLVALGVALLTANVALALGYFISAVAGSVTVALAISPPLLIPFMLFGGFFINSDHIPVYFIWLEYLSWFKYATEILMVNQWKHVDHIPCDNSTAHINSTWMVEPTPNCKFKTGADVLDFNSFKESRVFSDLMAILALIVGFRVLSFIVLLIRARRSKE